jgi:hypothetical protein
MKTYSGELKEGMTVFVKGCEGVTDGVYAFDNLYTGCVVELYHDNEWQLYKPQNKKVWGIPELKQSYFIVRHNDCDGGFYVCDCRAFKEAEHPAFLSKHHAEQHAKALNYINEFRALSDVPMDGVKQHIVHGGGGIDEWSENVYKLKYSIHGYVANSRDKAERDLAAYPKIALAHKIVTWGFHGIVEEVL